jgi:protein phosphatase
MKITIPELSLVALIGVSGSGKSTFASKHFKPTEVLSSDFYRALVSDDVNDLDATSDAFEALYFVAGKRLAAGKLAVVDATNVQPQARKPLIELAKEHYVLPVAIVFNVPEKVSQDWNRMRPDRNLPPRVIKRQLDQLRRAMRGLEREGFRYVHILTSPGEIDAVEIERQRLWVDKRDEHGPFDIVGDVHGCLDELIELLTQLGYTVGKQNGGFDVQAPAGRRAVFVGDLVDRGPNTPGVLRLVMNMVACGDAICVPGNHENKLLRALRGRKVTVSHGLAESLAQLEAEPEEFRKEVIDFLDGLLSHYVFDDGRLVAAHAGLRAEMHGRASRRVRDFALYGETTGETDEFGLPVRYNWARDYRGKAMVVYGHTPIPEPEWVNNTICLDTGCVFGGRLTALRYPEKELVSVPAARTYYEPIRPLAAPDAAPREDDVLDIEDVLGKRIVETRLMGNVTIQEENGLAALEVMSRFAADPRWLIYLPPTMSPSETSKLPDLLEHPAEAFSFFKAREVPQVVCEEKHMGSRAVLVVCRDEEAARRRFRVTDGTTGICYTRTGRRFFNDLRVETELLERVRSAVTTAGLWDELTTDWICLDAELMPWSAKAQELLQDQYAAVGASARAALSGAVDVLDKAARRIPDTATLREKYQRRLEAVSAYVDSYRRYCWPVASIEDLRLAPFHLLASENAVHADRDHVWHLETLRRIARAEAEGYGIGILIETPYKVVNLGDEASEAEATQWWDDLTSRGGEGMVVKPTSFIATGRKGLIQPALKVRGREYLRIIYGPEYTLPEQVEQLRARSLGHKRSLALREFALGIEALERFVRNEPLYRVHEPVFGVLALESEPVDPRL